MANSSPSTAKTVRSKNGRSDAGRTDGKERWNGADGSGPSYEQIAQRAYEIYERDGRQPGRELENWLRAEAELTGSSVH
jgi:hypothetical protein